MNTVELQVIIGNNTKSDGDKLSSITDMVNRWRLTKEAEFQSASVLSLSTLRNEVNLLSEDNKLARMKAKREAATAAVNAQFHAYKAGMRGYKTAAAENHRYRPNKGRHGSFKGI